MPRPSKPPKNLRLWTGTSYSGFTQDGLEAFARGNATHIICMNGHELWQVMEQKLDLAEVLTRKTRRAAETGQAFADLRILYPI